MEVKKEMVCLSETVGENKAKTVVETDVIVPDTKPDVAKILQVDANCNLNGSEVQNERVLVYGTVDFYMVYVSEDNEIKGIKTQSSFTDIIDVPGAALGMASDVSCDVEHVDYRLLNGRKLTVKAVLDVDAEVLRETEQEAVTDIADAQVEKLYKTVNFVKKNGVFHKNFAVNEKVEIAKEMPAIQEILKMDGKISNKSTKVINNKVIVKADMDVVILYVDDQEFKPCSVSLSVPFTEILDIDGITEDWFTLQTMEVTGFQYTVEADEDGAARLIDLEANVESRTSTLENQSISVLSDCYGIRQQTNLVRSTADIRLNAGEIYVQTGVKDRIELGEAPAVSQIYNLTAKAYIDSVEAEEGSVTVKGKADAYLMYITKDETIPVYSVKKEIPFEEKIACAAGNDAIAEISAAVTGMSYTLNGDAGIDVRGNIEIKGIVTRKATENFISEVELTEKENEQKNASLTVCFVQDTDSLWDIAKRYCTSVSSIMEVNGLTESTKLAGRQLIVPKYR